MRTRAERLCGLALLALSALPARAADEWTAWKEAERVFADRSNITSTAIQTAIQGNKDVAYFVSPEILASMEECLFEAWKGPTKAPCSSDDKALMRFFHRYFLQGKNKYKFSMYVPKIAPDGAVSSVPKYKLTGYSKEALAADESVKHFIKLFLAGAHFVVIHSSEDIPSGAKGLPSLYEAFEDRLYNQTAYVFTNSHYAGALTNAWQGYYYPNNYYYDYEIDNDNDDIDIMNTTFKYKYPLVISFLINKTTYAAKSKDNTRPTERNGGSHNTFFQLEGWPGYAMTLQPFHMVRHGGDFKTHGDTKWNLSTWGASLYSEKRGTTVFIAPAVWTPTVDSQTTMMRYKGSWHEASSKAVPETWFQSELVGK